MRGVVEIVLLNDCIVLNIARDLLYYYKFIFNR